MANQKPSTTSAEAGAPSTKLAKVEPPATIGALVLAMKPTIQRCIPQHLNPERMARVALAAIRTTRNLSECTQASFGACLLGASLLGLEPNTPLQQCWLIPFQNNRKGGIFECQLLIGYQGMLELARRSGQTHPIQAIPVMQGDVFEYELGLHPRLVHKPNMNIDRDDYTKLTHVYAICRTKDPDAQPIFVVLSKAQVERRRGRGANGPAWKTDGVAMALKTAVRALWPWIPKSSEMALAEAMEARVDKGQTQVGVVSTMLDDQAVALIESSGVDLTADPDEDQEQPAPEPTPPEQDGKRVKLGANAAKTEAQEPTAPPMREPGED